MNNLFFPFSRLLEKYNLIALFLRDCAIDYEPRQSIRTSERRRQNLNTHRPDAEVSLNKHKSKDKRYAASFVIRNMSSPVCRRPMAVLSDNIEDTETSNLLTCRNDVCRTPK